jgi:hypothetical protein
VPKRALQFRNARESMNRVHSRRGRRLAEAQDQNL